MVCEKPAQVRCCWGLENRARGCTELIWPDTVGITSSSSSGCRGLCSQPSPAPFYSLPQTDPWAAGETAKQHRSCSPACCCSCVRQHAGGCRAQLGRLASDSEMRQQAAGEGNPCSVQLLWQEHGAGRMQEQVFLDVLFAQKQDATSWTELFLNFILRLLRFK